VELGRHHHGQVTLCYLYRCAAATLSFTVAEKVRLGGMALANGVLVHGPTAWACAVRTPEGELRVAADHKRFRAADVEWPLVRGPAKVAEVFSLLPALRRKLPEARFPFERPAVLAAMAASGVAVQLVRTSARVGPAAKELLAGLASVAPAAFALRGSSLAAYHGAEHISIGSYEQDKRAEREHERCGSHLIAPLLLTSALARAVAARLVGPFGEAARLTAPLVALAASTELFTWMARNPDHPISRALARPGHELQHRLATSTPTPEQLEVAEAALAACLELEDGGSRAD
jgi:Protein of unknown function (DUF1385)